MDKNCVISIRNLFTYEDITTLKNKLRKCLEGKGAQCSRTNRKDIIPRSILNHINAMVRNLKNMTGGNRYGLLLDECPAFINFQLGRCEQAISLLRESVQRNPECEVLKAELDNIP
ncbi:MAG: hypothetical protein JXA52_04515 [Planctomycetes bacterium]|nr:hypothetical protein [Planctomycetota bacterium]